eukprot:CAMPEP_0171331252 /NCGR_PEP_ID=MMETSP0878-20121228/2572_1 /TAXON_ID=67004 /ORGANISM="Thalassiosira weissflogii, Strain CCMP1336" /LENGTH=417 /DNA_ID=CAMNT_0011831751 /DNA_START=74 /DNA_END=1327 /DNA_ORIENTATION=-
MTSAPTTIPSRPISVVITALHLFASINSATSFQSLHPIQQQQHCFSLSSPRTTKATTTTVLHAKSNNNNNSHKNSKGSTTGGKGFGTPKPIQNSSGIYSKNTESTTTNKPNNNNNNKYSLRDKSYGIAPLPLQTFQEARDSMSLFFRTHEEWKPLFRHVSDEHESLAQSFLRDDASSSSSYYYYSDRGIWGISTMEGKTPWKLLPSKPTDPSHLNILSDFLDEWQTSLLDIPVDALVKEGSNDLHFLEEGRRTIAVTRFHVHTLEVVADVNANSDGNDDKSNNDDDNNNYYGMEEWENELFAKCWSEMAHIMSQDSSDTGSLIVLPSHPDIVPLSRRSSGEEDGIRNEEEDENELLSYLQSFVDDNLRRPIQWLGRQDDWEIVAFKRGNGAIRMLYKLSDIPDLGERDSGNDEQIRL